MGICVVWTFYSQCHICDFFVQNPVGPLKSHVIDVTRKMLLFVVLLVTPDVKAAFYSAL